MVWKVWFDFCGKIFYSSEIKNLGFFFQACVVPRDPNFISSVYHYHKFQNILVGDINDVEQRAVHQNEVDYMYGMQWPSPICIRFSFGIIKKCSLVYITEVGENLEIKNIPFIFV